MKKLSSKYLHEVVEVISEAFYGEAITSRVYDFSRESVRKEFRLNTEIMALTALKGNYPALVALEGNRVVGAAILKPVKPLPFSATWRIYLPRIPKLLRLFIKARCWQGMELKRKMEPPYSDLPPSYITLDAIGVAPGFQGKGVGAKLLQELPRLCRDEEAAGIYLFTGDDRNCDIYLKYGYRVVKTVEIGTLKVYHMFKSREPDNTLII